MTSLSVVSVAQKARWLPSHSIWLHACRDEVDRKIDADRQVRQAEERAKADILQAERDRLAQWRDTVPGQACSCEEDCYKHSRDHCQQVTRGAMERNFHRSGLGQ